MIIRHIICYVYILSPFMKLWSFYSILLVVTILLHDGCKKSQNATSPSSAAIPQTPSNPQNVTCSTTQSFKIGHDGSTLPANAMPGDSINFQADVLLPGKYVNYGYQPNAL